MAHWLEDCHSPLLQIAIQLSSAGYSLVHLCDPKLLPVDSTQKRGNPTDY
ncbi:hypothetical protein E2562_021817 [Oryza meyeriana var. granulata]|uniref:Uncharacterized protein n=1 Tax=Oryza meyeriana var. granulata TaxID=110450 RepID=A0A6G1EN97_9ORYZ|nr:hypothetical protein E2562_021817 [Oryza meyeriana var. granulata]